MNAERKIEAVRLERVRRQVMAGTFVTPDKLDWTAERLARVIEGRDRLYPFVATGIRDQRAINELTVGPRPRIGNAS